MRSLLDKYLLAPVRALLTQGLSPRLLALSLAVGLVVGIFPVLGTTTVLCTLVAAAFRLNLVAVHTVHFLMTPVQLLLIIPFVRVGEWVLGKTPQPLSISGGLGLIAQGALKAIAVLWDAILHAMLGWVLLGPALFVVAYVILAQVLKSTQHRLFKQPSAGRP
ncbi:MAG: DUF2062 domain-containing protein [Steroidobacteraceae bacterium]